jgi:hypothetical protein
MGLLGLAFHPNFPSNGYFFVNYTAPGPRRTVISRFTVSSTNPDSADISSEVIILEVDQPYDNHNGGQIAFGPDGYLYIALGDGGSGGDPLGHGQNRTTLLGSILRIDVDTNAEGKNYGIPSDNPFAGNASGYREEIFAYGLRNPWRFSFDATTGTIWCGDVGQGCREEIDIIEAGKNYAWNIMEGLLCYPPGQNCSPASCDTTGLVMPIVDYGRSLGSSVTGGYVYRGSSIPSLVGAYIYGDFGSGRTWTLRHDSLNTTNSEMLDTDLNISSFGVDIHNELYVCDYGGKVHKLALDPTSHAETAAPGLPRVLALGSFPNPFNSETTIRFEIGEPQVVNLKVYNSLGEEVAFLLEEWKESGTHAVSWNGSHLPSGVYFVTLAAETYSATHKLLLVR